MINIEHYKQVKQDLPAHTELCVVSKRRSREDILAYYDLGERLFAENKAQELLTKADLKDDIRWSFIGHLQRNKVRQILPYVSLIQSLDSLELAQVIEKECTRINKTVDVLAEFHLAVNDTNKTGLDEADALSFVQACRQFPHLRLTGMMAMGPHTDDEEEIRRVFTHGQELFEALQKECGDTFTTLSMGMSHDYRIACACGSTMVRIGSYLFED